MFAQEVNSFLFTNHEALESKVLLKGLLPPVVRGQRLTQNQQDKRPYMGGTSAENGTHFAAYLALRRQLLLKETPELDSQPHDISVLKSLKPYLGQELVPFAHRAVLQSLAAYGELHQNKLWNELDLNTQQHCHKHCFNTDSYYNPKLKRMHNLPDNYLWVTADNAQLITLLIPQSTTIKKVGRSAFKQLLTKLKKQLWFDDNPPWQVIDQYAWETVAATCKLAQHYATQTELKQLTRIANSYRETLYKLIRKDGYAFCWGRSQGIISYGTSINALINNGELLFKQNAISKEDFAHDIALARQAFKSLKNNWFDSDGLTSMHKNGRETFTYRRSHRLVGSSFSMLVKFIHLKNKLEQLDEAYELKLPNINLPENINHYESFTKTKSNLTERHYGLWIAKNKTWHLALPIIGNLNKFEPKVTSNYLPAPIMPFVIDVPTQRSGPYGTEYIELESGEVYAATNGCDKIEHWDKGITLSWERFLNIETLDYVSDLGKLTICYQLEGKHLRIEQVFSTKRKDIAYRYSLLGIAFEHGKQQTVDEFSFWTSSQKLKLKARGEILKLNLENVKNLPAGKSFLEHLPWHLSCFLPTHSSSFGLELTLETNNF